MVKRILTVCGVLALAAMPSLADINIFGINNITIDPQYTSPVIAPFTAACPPYPSCPSGNPTTWPQGFPIQNIFGAGIMTAEGVPDTIFSTASYQPGGYYDNVFFHLTNSATLTGVYDLTVTGSQDGPGNPNRSFSYFDLYTYSGNVNAPDYQLLFSGIPTTSANGFESISAPVTLNDAGPYFVYQFGAPIGPNGAPRIDGVSLTAYGPEPRFYGLLALGLASVVTIARRRKKA